MANQFLSLALFLMLLSFFIIMNGMSSFEDAKSRSAMNSIALAFSNEEPSEMKAPSDDPNLSIAVRTGDTLEAVEGLFSAHISGFEILRNRLGTTMHVRTSIGEFENAIDIFDSDSGNDMTTKEKGAFLPTIVTLLRSGEKGQSYRIDMVLNIPDDVSIYQKQRPNEFIKDLKRVSRLAESLEKSGLPKKMISAGLAKGSVGMIDIYIHRYKPFTMPALANSNIYK